MVIEELRAVFPDAKDQSVEVCGDKFEGPCFIFPF